MLCAVDVPNLGACLRSLCNLVRSCSWPHHSQKRQKNWIVVWRLSMSVSMETTQKTEKWKISTIERARTKFFFNEPELTCSYLHLIHSTYLFHMFFEIFTISW